MKKIAFFAAAVLLASCSPKLNAPSDKLATKETRELYYSLA